MSKNPAWNAYNETVRKLNEDYENAVVPLRKSLRENLTKTEAKYEGLIAPLLKERKAIVEELQVEYAESVVEHEVARRKAVKVAHDVLQAEIAAFKSQAKAASDAVAA